MKIHSPPMICLRVFLCIAPFIASTASARHHDGAPEYTAPANSPGKDPAALPLETPPTINPEAAPSLTLQPFLNTHLDKVLAPLGTAAFAQTDLIASVRDSYAKALPTATDVRKPAYQLALAVCDALTNAIAERQKAAQAMNDSYNVRSSEAIQPRGGKQAVHDQDKDESFFYNSQKNNWLQNAATLRQGIVTLYQRERAAETKAGGPWSAPAEPPEPAAPVAATATMPPPTSAAAAATPSASVPIPAADPILGDWTWEGRAPLKLAEDHSIGGSRQGKWVYTCTTDAGRNYELHWQHKGWVDYVVLSADGKVLDGKSKEGKYVSASR